MIYIYIRYIDVEVNNKSNQKHGVVVFLSLTGGFLDRSHTLLVNPVHHFLHTRLKLTLLQGILCVQAG